MMLWAAELIRNIIHSHTGIDLEEAGTEDQISCDLEEDTQLLQ